MIAIRTCYHYSCIPYIPFKIQVFYYYLEREFNPFISFENALLGPMMCGRPPPLPERRKNALDGISLNK